MDTAAITEQMYLAFDELSQRSTQPRKMIADHLIHLAQTGGNFSTDELWQTLRGEHASIGRATVFRAVDKLVAKGILDRIDFADGTHRYRVCGDHHHHHLTCSSCHRVVEIDFCLSADQIARMGAQTHFVIEGHALSLFGLCEQCRAHRR